MKIHADQTKPGIKKQYPAISWSQWPGRPFITLSILLISMLLYGCNKGNEKAAKPKPKKIPLVSVRAAQQTDMTAYIDITGTIEANISTQIKAPADGIVKSLAARENQRVAKDKVIAVIDPIDRVALISENQLKLEQIENALRNTVSGTEEHDSLTRGINKAKQDLEYAKNMYKTIPVICPMDGMVTNRIVDVGSRVSAQDHMFTVSNMNSLVIKAEVNEKYFEAMSQGKKLPVILNAYPNDTVQGIISLVYPQVDPVTRNIKIDVTIRDFNKKLLPGMMASIKIPVSVKEKVVSIPEQAILTSPQNKQFLFVVHNDSIALKRWVQKGMAVGNKTEVMAGLKEGEKVVVAGQEMLKDSMKVKILNNK